MKLFFFTLILTLGSLKVRACTCTNLNAAELLLESDTVSLAKVKNNSYEITREMSDEDDWVGRTGILTEFEIINGYKNSKSKSMRVISPANEGENCSVQFKKDEIIILSTIEHPTTFEMVTTSCSVSHLDNQKAYKLMIELDELSKK